MPDFAVMRAAHALLVLCFSPLAFAQANYDGALIGGRSSLMGGTGVAAGIDAAALTQNPATTIDIEGTSLAFSTFATQLTWRTLHPDDGPPAEIRRGETDLGETQLNVIPNATCLFLDLERDGDRRRGAHKLSFCVTQPERAEFELESRALAVAGTGAGFFQTRSVSQLFTKQVYSAGWAYGLSEQVSIGITPMLESVAFVDSEALTTLVGDETSGDAIVGTGARHVASIMTKSARSVAFSALIGVQYRFRKGWAAGASLQFPSLTFTGEYEASRSAETTASDAAEYAQDTGDARFRYPPRIAAGIAGTLPWMTFELDAYFHTGSSRFAEIVSSREFLGIAGGVVSEVGTTNVTQTERVRPTLNVGVGADVPIGKKWSVVSGILTDFSGLPARPAQASADDSLFRSRINAVHASAGVAWTPRVGSLMLGVRGMYGQGELALSDPRTLPTERVAVDQSLWGLALVVSGQVTLGLLAMVDPTGLVKEAAEENAESKGEK